MRLRGREAEGPRGREAERQGGREAGRQRGRVAERQRGSVLQSNRAYVSNAQARGGRPCDELRRHRHLPLAVVPRAAAL